MLEMRPNCERCDCDLTADSPLAYICSFECTFCQNCCEEELQHCCPNCGGELRQRPSRAAEHLEKFPASTQRVITSTDADARAEE